MVTVAVVASVVATTTPHESGVAEASEQQPAVERVLVKQAVIEPTTTTAAPAKAVTTVAKTDDAVVRSAQRRLDELGYWNGKADGKAGASTAQAVMAFQKVEGLKRTGALDDATRTALGRARRPTASVTSDGVVVDKAKQVIFVVENGVVKYTFNTSTGSEKPYWHGGVKYGAKTPEGDFAVIREVNRNDPGPLGSLYRPKYLTDTGIAIHGSPSIPGYPASHGCARVSNAVMDLIWSENLMPMGSPVTIIG